MSEKPNFLTNIKAAFSKPEEECHDNYTCSELRTIKALKKLQLEYIHQECDMFRKIYEIEQEFQSKISQLNDKRKMIVSGEYRPTDEECEWDDEDDDDEHLNGVLPKETTVDVEEKPGLQNFWLNVFQNDTMISELIESEDEQVLKHLIDVTVDLKPMKNENEAEFLLIFHFDKNDYFSNSILTKKYTVTYKPLEKLYFTGPIIMDSEGCKIDWLSEEKNLTLNKVRTITKSQRGGKRKFQNKYVQRPSFFKFFDPPKKPESEELLKDVDLNTEIASDYEIGNMLKEEVIPRAILYFTGEIKDIDEDDEEDGSDFGDYDGEDDEDDEGAEDMDDV
ncbi:Nucleosome assembly protein 1 [Intoshia linei]|uniref:Nucleosome assembly protein 1 n=1 Tax=Intoshia linei TaxID=1819745 RepID=A0A177BA51_9BILA|nr:Nucleosome assembly protein 1 [Intoshia linei]